MTFIYASWAITMMVGFPVLYAIMLSDDMYDFLNVFNNKKDFLGCVFTYQILVYIITKDHINLIGIIILEVIVSFLVLPINIITFIVLILLLIVIMICKLFYFLFKKR